MKRPTLRQPRPLTVGRRAEPVRDPDLERLLQVCLSIPKHRRTLAAELLSILKRAQE